MKRKLTPKEIAAEPQSKVKRKPVRMAANSGVWIKAGKGRKREHGIYIGDISKDSISVLLDEQYRSGKKDDGVREVGMDWIEVPS